ncbi:MAG: HutD family protein [Burkholderiaceae bacterium]|nr:HutD family protein [Roseateles sp.]MBV8471365.1 HutD family protein [Burkholderiaceae bacterium]
MTWHCVQADQVSPQRWRNGGGWTRELLTWPAGASGASSGNWALRISVADIEADGPFSAFPGIARWFAVLQGAGVRLFERDWQRDDGLLAFDGALAPDCRLLDGMTRDFNLMHRQDQGRIAVETVQANAAQRLRIDASGDWCGLFLPEGGELSAAGQSLSLAPLTLVWTQEQTSAQLRAPGPVWRMQWTKDRP